MIHAETIKKKGEFSELFSQARHVQNGMLVMYLKENPKKSIRYGICIARKIGSQVERNRVKRRLREILRAYLTRMKIGYDILVVARYPCKNAGFSMIKEKFQDVCSKAGILTGA